jgi:kynureninase
MAAKESGINGNTNGDDQSNIFAANYAQKRDEQDPLSRLRDDFIIPRKSDVKSNTIRRKSDGGEEDESCVYLCGNSLGLQPKRTREYMNTYLDTWATKGVFGHFRELEDQLTRPWLHLNEVVTDQTSKIVGAEWSEVAVMETLTANLHLLMASFYRPSGERNKIIIESKAFPSDHVSIAFYF